MDNQKNSPVTFNIKRRTPEARGKSWAGTLVFGFGLLIFAAALFLGVMRIIENMALMLIAVPFIVVGIVLWTKSNNAQNGTLTFHSDMIMYKCGSESFKMLPGQVTHVNQSGNQVRIIFAGKTLYIVSPDATQITHNVNAFMAAYNNLAPQAAAPAPAPVQKSAPDPDEIRKYKQLVDEGIITQQQFDEILKKMTE